MTDARRSQRAGSARCLGKSFSCQSLAFLFQVVAPGVGDPEDATLVSAFFLGQADAAVAIAGTGPGEGDPEQEPVGPLARAGASDRDMRHRSIKGGGMGLL